MSKEQVEKVLHQASYPNCECAECQSEFPKEELNPVRFKKEQVEKVLHQASYPNCECAECQSEFPKEELNPVHFKCVKCSRLKILSEIGVSVINHEKCIPQLPPTISICKECMQAFQIDLMTGNFKIFAGISKLFSR